jgi:hypothetical protein
MPSVSAAKRSRHGRRVLFALVHDQLGVLLEVEAGREHGEMPCTATSFDRLLFVGARYLALGMMQEYRHQSGGREITVLRYRDSREQLDAIFATARLGLPFEGVLLFGY